jgi:hypothetical protein
MLGPIATLKWKETTMLDNTLRQSWNAAIDAHHAACDAESEAESALLKTPAPGLMELRFKLETLLKLGGVEERTVEPWSAELVEPVLADIKRLLV